MFYEFDQTPLEKGLAHETMVLVGVCSCGHIPSFGLVLSSSLLAPLMISSINRSTSYNFPRLFFFIAVLVMHSKIHSPT